MGSLIHNVFHMSLLKRFVGKNINSSIEVPYIWEVKERQPEEILDRRVVKRNNRIVSQVLVKWKGAHVEDATWEDYHTVASRLPPANFKVEV